MSFNSSLVSRVLATRNRLGFDKASTWKVGCRFAHCLIEAASCVLASLSRQKCLPGSLQNLKLLQFLIVLVLVNRDLSILDLWYVYFAGL